jgi:hypothetical protein
MEYEKTVPISPDGGQQALDAAAAAFSAAGLEVHARTGSTFAISCWPRLWNLQLHPLRFISQGTVSVQADCLTIHAELDNLWRFARFLLAMLCMLDLVAVFVVAYSPGNGPPSDRNFAMALVVVLSLAAVPMEFFKQKRRAIRRIGKLVAQAVQTPGTPARQTGHQRSFPTNTSV